LGRILSSITRMSIIEAAPQAGIPVREVPVTANELLTADEIFTAHTGIKVEPVSRLENRELPAPGPVTKKLMQLMDNIIQFKDDRFKDWFQQL
jgi:branched-chain amino acid aminotransferase